MTIEDLFGTLQQSVVSSWRKHLKTHKYSNHMALNDFYEEMPEKVDALIEAWMGVNGKKVKSFNNIVKASNMGTLKYLKELRSVCKQGYSLMNGEKELEALLDDIVELIDSTLYKIKELSENQIKDLKQYIIESINITESFKGFEDLDHIPDPWDLADLMIKLKRNKNTDIGKYFDQDEWDEYGDDIKKMIVRFVSLLDRCNVADLGHLDEDSFMEPDIRKKVGIKDNESGFALYKGGSENLWSIFIFKNVNSLKGVDESIIHNILDKYEENHVMVERFSEI